MPWSAPRPTRRRAAGRGLLLWAGLMVVYLAAIGLPASPANDLSPAEAHRLLTALSIAQDRDLELTNQYLARDWAPFYDGDLVPTSAPYEGRLVEAQGIWLPALLAPAYALGGRQAAKGLCAALMALAVLLGAALARRVVPEPWATRGAVLIGLSPPVVLAAATIGPEAPVAAVLTGSAILALRVRDAPTVPGAVGCASLAALLPWLSVRAAPLALVLSVALWRWLRRRRRGLAGLLALEALLVSAVVYVTIDDRLYGGPFPYAGRLGAGTATGLADAAGLLDRLPRLAGVLVDRDAGLLRWAPVLALVAVGAWLLVRSVRSRLAKVLEARVDAEAAAGLGLVLLCTGLAVGALGTPSLHGPWLAVPSAVAVLPCAAGLAAWGLQRLPRAGAALGAVTCTGTAWVVLGTRLDDGAGVAPPVGALPWAGVEALLPRVDGWDLTGGAWFAVLVAGLAAGVLTADGAWRRRARPEPPPAAERT